MPTFGVSHKRASQMTEAEHLRGLIRLLLKDEPLVSCEHFHHYKPDLNHGFNECPPYERWKRIIEAMRAALGKSAKP